jgi:hypothetical protein
MEQHTATTTEAAQGEPPDCGMVMPISAIGDYTEKHWLDVRNILDEAITSAGFVPSLVSDADDIGIIHKRIVQNLYCCPIILCDVSGRNPNVMFELGLRLAFDKPTVIVKDDATPYSFDTSPIEHLQYPRDLRYSDIVGFKTSLAEKIKATYERSRNDKNYTTFLKHFGKFTVASLETTEVTPDKFIIEQLTELRDSIGVLRRELRDRDPVTPRKMIRPSKINETFALADKSSFISDWIRRQIEEARRNNEPIDKEKIKKEVMAHAGIAENGDLVDTAYDMFIDNILDNATKQQLF